MENNRDHLPTKGYQYTKFKVPANFTYWDNVFTRFPVFDLWWPQMTFDLHGDNNRDHLSTYQGLPTYQVWSSGNFHLLRYRVYKVSSLWQLVTSNDLWSPWKTIGIIYSPRATDIPSLKFRQLLLLEISCLQGRRHTRTHAHKHTHTHTPSPSHRFLWPSARNQKARNPQKNSHQIWNPSACYLFLVMQRKALVKDVTNIKQPT